MTASAIPTQQTFVADLLEMRDVYMAARPQFRLNVIQQRLADDNSEPGRLITLVSGVEALARSLEINRQAKDRSDIKRLYSRYKDRSAVTLVQDFLRSKGVIEPAAAFSPGVWATFRHAVNYRNLMVHECTYLGQDKYPSLIDATQSVLDELVRRAHLRRRA